MKFHRGYHNINSHYLELLLKKHFVSFYMETLCIANGCCTKSCVRFSAYLFFTVHRSLHFVHSIMGNRQTHSHKKCRMFSLFDNIFLVLSSLVFNWHRKGIANSCHKNELYYPPCHSVERMTISTDDRNRQRIKVE